MFGSINIHINFWNLGPYFSLKFGLYIDPYFYLQESVSRIGSTGIIHINLIISLALRKMKLWKDLAQKMVNKINVHLVHLRGRYSISP